MKLSDYGRVIATRMRAGIVASRARDVHAQSQMVFDFADVFIAPSALDELVQLTADRNPVLVNMPEYQQEMLRAIQQRNETRPSRG